MLMAVVGCAEAGIRGWRAGATMLQLRCPQLTAGEMEAEAEQLIDACPLHLLVNGRPDVARAVGAAGVHLPESGLPVAAARRVLGGPGMVGRSVHSLQGARRARDEGADYVVLGPIFATRTHPGEPELGLDVLAEAAAELEIAVLAIGGITRSRVPACLDAGAAGIAAVGLFEGRDP